MELEIGKKYKLVFIINSEMLTYSVEIKEDDGNFITFIDKFNKKYIYNKQSLVSAEEIL